MSVPNGNNRRAVDSGRPIVSDEVTNQSNDGAVSNEEIEKRNDNLRSFRLMPFLWWFPSLLVGGGFWHSILGYAVSFAIAWILTFVTYSFIPAPPTVDLFATRVAAFSNDVSEGAKMIDDVNVEICPAVTSSKTWPQKIDFSSPKVDDKVFASILFHYEFPQDAHKKQRFWLSFSGADGSNSEVKSNIPIEFFCASKGSAPFAFTRAITTPASVHAFEKSFSSFLTRLKESEAGQYDSALGDSIENLVNVSIKKDSHFGNLQLTNTRRLNGFIQASTIFVFWTLVIQLIARLIVNVLLEWRIRTSPLLEFLWDDKESSRAALKQISEETEAMKTRIRRRTLRIPTWLIIYTYARDAFMVEGDYKAVPGFVASAASECDERISAGKGFIRFLIWSIPTIGFIGTVVGIGLALEETVNVDSVARDAAAIAKSTVSSSIGVAFDTTLVALVLSLFGMLLFHVGGQLEELVVQNAKHEAELNFIRVGASIPNNELAHLLAEELAAVRQSTSRLRQVVSQFKTREARTRAASKRSAGTNGEAKKMAFVIFALLLLLLVIYLWVSGVISIDSVLN